MLPLFWDLYNPFQKRIKYHAHNTAYCIQNKYKLLYSPKLWITLKQSLIIPVVLDSHDTSRNFASTSYSFIKMHLFWVSDRVKVWHPNNEFAAFDQFLSSFTSCYSTPFWPQMRLPGNKKRLSNRRGKMALRAPSHLWHLHYSSGRTFLASMRSRFICKGNAHCNHIVTKLILILYGCNNIKD